MAQNTKLSRKTFSSPLHQLQRNDVTRYYRLLGLFGNSGISKKFLDMSDREWDSHVNNMMREYLENLPKDAPWTRGRVNLRGHKVNGKFVQVGDLPIDIGAKRGSAELALAPTAQTYVGMIDTLRAIRQEGLNDLFFYTSSEVKDLGRGKKETNSYEYLRPGMAEIIREALQRENARRLSPDTVNDDGSVTPGKFASIDVNDQDANITGKDILKAILPYVRDVYLHTHQMNEERQYRLHHLPSHKESSSVAYNQDFWSPAQVDKWSEKIDNTLEKLDTKDFWGRFPSLNQEIGRLENSPWLLSNTNLGKPAVDKEGYSLPNTMIQFGKHKISPKSAMYLYQLLKASNNVNINPKDVTQSLIQYRVGSASSHTPSAFKVNQNHPYMDEISRMMSVLPPEVLNKDFLPRMWNALLGGTGKSVLDVPYDNLIQMNNGARADELGRYRSWYADYEGPSPIDSLKQHEERWGDYSGRDHVSTSTGGQGVYGDVEVDQEKFENLKRIWEEAKARGDLKGLGSFEEVFPVLSPRQLKKVHLQANSVNIGFLMNLMDREQLDAINKKLLPAYAKLKAPDMTQEDLQDENKVKASLQKDYQKAIDMAGKSQGGDNIWDQYQRLTTDPARRAINAYIGDAPLEIARRAIEGILGTDWNRRKNPKSIYEKNTGNAWDLYSGLVGRLNGESSSVFNRNRKPKTEEERDDDDEHHEDNISGGSGIGGGGDNNTGGGSRGPTITPTITPTINRTRSRTIDPNEIKLKNQERKYGHLFGGIKSGDELSYFKLRRTYEDKLVSGEIDKLTYEDFLDYWRRRSNITDDTKFNAWLQRTKEDEAEAKRFENLFGHIQPHQLVEAFKARRLLEDGIANGKYEKEYGNAALNYWKKRFKHDNIQEKKYQDWLANIIKEEQDQAEKTRRQNQTEKFKDYFGNISEDDELGAFKVRKKLAEDFAQNKMSSEDFSDAMNYWPYRFPTADMGDKFDRWNRRQWDKSKAGRDAKIENEYSELFRNANLRDSLDNIYKARQQIDLLPFEGDSFATESKLSSLRDYWARHFSQNLPENKKTTPQQLEADYQIWLKNQPTTKSWEYYQNLRNRNYNQLRGEKQRKINELIDTADKRLSSINPGDLAKAFEARKSIEKQRELGNIDYEYNNAFMRRWKERFYGEDNPEHIEQLYKDWVQDKNTKREYFNRETESYRQNRPNVSNWDQTRKYLAMRWLNSQPLANKDYQEGVDYFKEHGLWDPAGYKKAEDETATWNLAGRKKRHEGVLAASKENKKKSDDARKAYEDEIKRQRDEREKAEREKQRRDAEARAEKARRKAEKAEARKRAKLDKEAVEYFKNVNVKNIDEIHEHRRKLQEDVANGKITQEQFDHYKKYWETHFNLTQEDHDKYNKDKADEIERQRKHKETVIGYRNKWNRRFNQETGQGDFLHQGFNVRREINKLHKHQRIDDLENRVAVKEWRKYFKHENDDAFNAHETERKRVKRENRERDARTASFHDKWFNIFGEYSPTRKNHAFEAYQKFMQSKKENPLDKEEEQIAQEELVKKFGNLMNFDDMKAKAERREWADNILNGNDQKYKPTQQEIDMHYWPGWLDRIENVEQLPVSKYLVRKLLYKYFKPKFFANDKTLEDAVEHLEKGFYDNNELTREQYEDYKKDLQKMAPKDWLYPEDTRVYKPKYGQIYKPKSGEEHKGARYVERIAYHNIMPGTPKEAFRDMSTGQRIRWSRSKNRWINMPWVGRTGKRKPNSWFERFLKWDTKEKRWYYDRSSEARNADKAEDMAYMYENIFRNFPRVAKHLKIEPTSFDDLAQILGEENRGQIYFDSSGMPHIAKSSNSDELSEVQSMPPEEAFNPNKRNYRFIDDYDPRYSKRTSKYRQSPTEHARQILQDSEFQYASENNRNVPPAYRAPQLDNAWVLAQNNPFLALLRKHGGSWKKVEAELRELEKTLMLAEKNRGEYQPQNSILEREAGDKLWDTYKSKSTALANIEGTNTKGEEYLKPLIENVKQKGKFFEKERINDGFGVQSPEEYEQIFYPDIEQEAENKAESANIKWPAYNSSEIFDKAYPEDSDNESMHTARLLPTVMANEDNSPSPSIWKDLGKLALYTGLSVGSIYTLYTQMKKLRVELFNNPSRYARYREKFPYVPGKSYNLNKGIPPFSIRADVSTPYKSRLNLVELLRQKELALPSNYLDLYRNISKHWNESAWVNPSNFIKDISHDASGNHEPQTISLEYDYPEIYNKIIDRIETGRYSDTNVSGVSMPRILFPAFPVLFSNIPNSYSQRTKRLWTEMNRNIAQRENRTLSIENLIKSENINRMGPKVLQYLRNILLESDDKENARILMSIIFPPISAFRYREGKSAKWHLDHIKELIPNKEDREKYIRYVLQKKSSMASILKYPLSIFGAGFINELKRSQWLGSKEYRKIAKHFPEAIPLVEEAVRSNNPEYYLPRLEHALGLIQKPENDDFSMPSFKPGENINLSKTIIPALMGAIYGLKGIYERDKLPAYNESLVKNIIEPPIRNIEDMASKAYYATVGAHDMITGFADKGISDAVKNLIISTGTQYIGNNVSKLNSVANMAISVPSSVAVVNAIAELFDSDKKDQRIDNIVKMGGGLAGLYTGAQVYKFNPFRQLGLAVAPGATWLALKNVAEVYKTLFIIHKMNAHFNSYSDILFRFVNNGNVLSGQDDASSEAIAVLWAEEMLTKKNLMMRELTTISNKVQSALEIGNLGEQGGDLLLKLFGALQDQISFLEWYNDNRQNIISHPAIASGMEDNKQTFMQYVTQKADIFGLLKDVAMSKIPLIHLALGGANALWAYAGIFGKEGFGAPSPVITTLSALATYSSIKALITNTYKAYNAVEVNDLASFMDENLLAIALGIKAEETDKYQTIQNTLQTRLEWLQENGGSPQQFQEYNDNMNYYQQAFNSIPKRINFNEAAQILKDYQQAKAVLFGLTTYFGANKLGLSKGLANTGLSIGGAVLAFNKGLGLVNYLRSNGLTKDMIDTFIFKRQLLDLGLGITGTTMLSYGLNKLGILKPVTYGAATVGLGASTFKALSDIYKSYKQYAPPVSAFKIAQLAGSAIAGLYTTHKFQETVREAWRDKPLTKAFNETSINDDTVAPKKDLYTQLSDMGKEMLTSTGFVGNIMRGLQGFKVAQKYGTSFVNNLKSIISNEDRMTYQPTDNYSPLVILDALLNKNMWKLGKDAIFSISGALTSYSALKNLGLDKAVIGSLMSYKGATGIVPHITELMKDYNSFMQNPTWKNFKPMIEDTALVSADAIGTYLGIQNMGLQHVTRLGFGAFNTFNGMSKLLDGFNYYTATGNLPTAKQLIYGIGQTVAGASGIYHGGKEIPNDARILYNKTKTFIPSALTVGAVGASAYIFNNFLRNFKGYLRGDNPEAVPGLSQDAVSLGITGLASYMGIKMLTRQIGQTEIWKAIKSAWQAYTGPKTEKGFIDEFLKILNNETGQNYTLDDNTLNITNQPKQEYNLWGKFNSLWDRSTETNPAWANISDQTRTFAQQHVQRDYDIRNTREEEQENKDNEALQRYLEGREDFTYEPVKPEEEQSGANPIDNWQEREDESALNKDKNRISPPEPRPQFPTPVPTPPTVFHYPSNYTGAPNEDEALQQQKIIEEDKNRVSPPEPRPQFPTPVPTPGIYHQYPQDYTGAPWSPENDKSIPYHQYPQDYQGAPWSPENDQSRIIVPGSPTPYPPPTPTPSPIPTPTPTPIEFGPSPSPTPIATGSPTPYPYNNQSGDIFGPSKSPVPEANNYTVPNNIQKPIEDSWWNKLSNNPKFQIGSGLAMTALGLLSGGRAFRNIRRYNQYYRPNGDRIIDRNRPNPNMDTIREGLIDYVRVNPNSVWTDRHGIVRYSKGYRDYHRQLLQNYERSVGRQQIYEAQHGDDSVPNDIQNMNKYHNLNKVLNTLQGVVSPILTGTGLTQLGRGISNYRNQPTPSPTLTPVKYGPSPSPTQIATGSPIPYPSPTLSTPQQPSSSTPISVKYGPSLKPTPIATGSPTPYPLSILSPSPTLPTSSAKTSFSIPTIKPTPSPKQGPEPKPTSFFTKEDMPKIKTPKKIHYLDMVTYLPETPSNRILRGRYNTLLKQMTKQLFSFEEINAILNKAYTQNTDKYLNRNLNSDREILINAYHLKANRPYKYRKKYGDING